MAYDQYFHEGVNIIRGQNGSGKTTIADFIFFILGGEFKDWKNAASKCDEVQAEVETPRGKLTLSRQMGSVQQPMSLYFGPMEVGLQSSREGWERFPIRRHAGRESFSQVMFRSILIPEAQSEGAANITMHQLMRLCYSDQRTPATRLFRFEPFDTQSIREAVGNLVCGVGGYEVYEIGLQLRELQDELKEINARLSALHDALSVDQAFNTPDRISAQISVLEKESVDLRNQVENVATFVKPGEVKDYLADRKKAHELLIKQRGQLKELEFQKRNIEYELREIGEYIGYLDGLKEKLTFAEASFHAIGSIEFTRCPACGEELEPEVPANHCLLCKSGINPESEKAKYNQIRLDLEIQTRESGHLLGQKKSEIDVSRRDLSRLRRQHKKHLSMFDLKYSSDHGPREAFLAPKINRLGQIDTQIDFLLKSLEIAKEISEVASRKAEIAQSIDFLKKRSEKLQQQARTRRAMALSLISKIGAKLLRLDLEERQSEFVTAKELNVNFQNDSISVGGLVNFAESSNVILKNSAVLALFLAAGKDAEFNHPRFLLIDNIEDKGMEEVRSHLFQRIIVERVTELNLPHQVIYTTSMMNPELELNDYTIGPAYTSESRSLEFPSDV